jgi:hypothetical protein
MKKPTCSGHNFIIYLLSLLATITPLSMKKRRRNEKLISVRVIRYFSASNTKQHSHGAMKLIFKIIEKKSLQTT